MIVVFTNNHWMRGSSFGVCSLQIVVVIKHYIKHWNTAQFVLTYSLKREIVSVCLCV